MIAANIAPAGSGDLGEALALVEALLVELGDEGQEFAQIDRHKLERDLEAASLSGRFLALLAREVSGNAIGVLTLSASFAVYAGGEYGVIDEMYVRPEYRGQGVGRALVEAAVSAARQRRWFRLDVTGPNAAGECGPYGREPGGATVGAAPPDPAEGAPRDGGAGPPAGAALPGAALRFYRRLGFEPTGQKLRLLV